MGGEGTARRRLGWEKKREICWCWLVHGRKAVMGGWMGGMGAGNGWGSVLGEEVLMCVEGN